MGEEIANSVSHGVGFVLAIAALPILVVNAMPRGAAAVAGAAVFAATLALLYLASTLYHAITHERAKRVLRVFDHAAIYLLIAGTYTPFTLGVLRGPWGWSLLAVIWTLAVAGITLKSTLGMRWPKLSTAVYLLMGWLVVVAAKPLVSHMSAAGIAWLLAGGLAYTAGVAFYAAPRLRYAHFVWHLAVMAGTACHFVAVLRYAA
ncbi:MAG: hemolysin III family protein [Candidatus Eisenbacteria bacterium]|uniref:Hemolysin III family protein n=1 Tax=Eiseniibacteriota bacterium TaxID=2212470 RepID=A0A933W157_UNCEI|nr:hemolysin III family protein [Candidatus Eisenbacteria bacterium]